MTNAPTPAFARWGSVGFGMAVFLIVIGFFYVSEYEQSRQVIVDKTDVSHVSVILTENGFEPRYVRIKSGTEVVFTTTRDEPFWPASDLHPSHDIYSDFDPMRPIESDGSWLFTFDRAGEWGVHDHIRSYFTGKIYVEEQ